MIADAHLDELAPGVFAFVQPDGSWWLNNAGVVVNSGEVVAVDTCATAERTAVLADAIRSLGAGSPRLIVNTHEHSDHTHGNSYFPDALVVAHSTVRAAIERRGIVRAPEHFTPFEVGDLSPRAPDVTFATELVIWAGSVACEVRHVGLAAQRARPSVVVVRERGVVFTGDLVFNGVTPLMMAGSVAGVQETVDGLIRSFDAEWLVPGHGEPGGAELIDANLRYCALVWSAARDALRLGRSALETARTTELGEFESWSDPERLVANIHRALADLDGLPGSSPLDYPAVMADMIALSGRPLLVTHL